MQSRQVERAAAAAAAAAADCNVAQPTTNTANANVETDDNKALASCPPLPLPLPGSNSNSNCRLPNGDLVDSKNTCQSFFVSPLPLPASPPLVELPAFNPVQPLSTDDSTAAVVTDTATVRIKESPSDVAPLSSSEKHGDGKATLPTKSNDAAATEPNNWRGISTGAQQDHDDDGTVQTTTTVGGVILGSDNEAQFKNPKESPLFLYHEHMTRRMENGENANTGSLSDQLAATTALSGHARASIVSPFERRPTTTATVLSDSILSESLISALTNSLASSATASEPSARTVTAIAAPPPFATACVMLDDSETDSLCDEDLVVHLDHDSTNTTTRPVPKVTETPQDPPQDDAVEGSERENNDKQGSIPVERRSCWEQKRFRTVAVAAVIGLVVVIAVVVGSVCGSSGNRCGRSGHNDLSTTALRGGSVGNPTNTDTTNVQTAAAATAATRSQRIIEFINNATLTNRSILVDRDATTNATTNDTVSSSDAGADSFDTSIDVTPFLTAEEWALHWIIESDPLQLDLVSDANDSLSMASSFRIIQRYALLTLWFQQFQNRAWTNSTNWLTDPNECSWFGVSCREELDVVGVPNDAVVVRIELPNYGLIGTLSPDLGLLTAIQAVDVSGNSMTGTIPMAWGEQWTDLRSFSLLRNVLRGPLPSNIGQWSLLEYFDVSESLLSGTIPRSIGNWSNIRFVSLGQSAFVGSFPVALDQWPYLEHFNVYSNQLNGTILDRIGGSSSSNNNLTHVSLGYNMFSGTMPASVLGKWTNLRYFEADGCGNLSGTLPASIGNWTNIEQFFLSFAALTGTLPESIRSWSKVQNFQVGSNALSGTIPEFVGSSWPNMKGFSVGMNNFTGTLPESIGQWTNLTFFEVSSNQLSGTIPSSVGRWRLAEYATFSGNNFSGTVPQGLCLLASNATGSSLAAVLLNFNTDCGNALACDCCVLCSDTSSPVAVVLGPPASIGTSLRQSYWN